MHFSELGAAWQNAPECAGVPGEFPRTAAGQVSKRDVRASLA
jgi:hypothetical protein